MATSSIASSLVKCADKQPFYFKFIPVNFATLKPNEATKIIGRCFQDITLSLNELDDSFEMKIFAKDKLHWYCSELIIMSTEKLPNIASR